MPQIIIRLARAREQRSLENLQWRASLHESVYRDALLAHPDAIELPLRQIQTGGVFVAEAGGVVHGFAAILPREDGDCELDGLFVEPAHWGQGVGRALVEHCCREGESVGAAFLHVVGNPHAEGFYTACGFRMVGTTPTRFGSALLMRRPL